MKNEEKGADNALATPLEIGAHKGAFFGVYLSVMFLTFVNSDGDPFWSAFALTLVVGTPFVLFKILRHVFRAENGEPNFARLWSVGLMTFAFASLIVALVTYAWLEFVFPDFLYVKAQEAINAYNMVPELRDSQLVEVLKAAVKNGDLPTNIQFVFDMILNTVMGGAILSLPIAWLAGLGRKR